MLRTETESDHRAVEDSVPLMHAGLSVDEYVSCLSRIYGIVAAWERLSSVVAPEWMQVQLLERRRLPMLERDLACFGVAAPKDRTPALPWIEDIPSLLGAMYVMEGSTLGGQIIARHVCSELHLRQGEGNAFFRGHGEHTGAMWKEFCEVLKMRVTDEQAPAVIASAKTMFAVFGGWMRQRSAADDS